MSSRALRIGILDLLTTPARNWSDAAYHLVMTKQYASITPQAIAVWCRELGHRSFYATYYGIGDPRRALPDDLDVIFVATYTQASALAYALAKLYRRSGVTTVVGGPHAKAFPGDCLRFFDLVVGDCDRTLIANVVAGAFAPGSFITSARPFTDVPSVAERLPEIRASAFALGRPFAATTIPLLASTGCPYRCDFCTDWNSPYRPLPAERLTADLRYVAERFPGTMIGFHDPNFAIRFDETLDVMETIPTGARSPYVAETSLSVLRDDRLRRLRDTQCVSLAPGVESWTDYAPKAGVGRMTGREKLQRLIERFRALHEYVPYLQANFLFGLDDDVDDEPVALTKAFMAATPFVWPVINIPYPFGGTPLFARYLDEGRILATMPFSFYYSPYLVTRLRHYAPAAYYRRMIELFEHFTAPAMLAERLRTSPHLFVRAVHRVRTAVKRSRVRAFRRLVGLLESDRDVRAFHEGRSHTLPAFYHVEYERLLGHFAPLMPRVDRTPELGQPDATVG
jgi:radical SAM superfamily enzyme YgiQ (UPF0313 family)